MRAPIWSKVSNVSQSQKHKIMIVGAGIAGSSSTCLRQSGHDVTILEQASATRYWHLGFAQSQRITCAERDGIGDRLASKADIPTELSIRDFKSEHPCSPKKWGQGLANTGQAIGIATVPI